LDTITIAQSIESQLLQNLLDILEDGFTCLWANFLDAVCGIKRRIEGSKGPLRGLCDLEYETYSSIYAQDPPQPSTYNVERRGLSRQGLSRFKSSPTPLLSRFFYYELYWWQKSNKEDGESIEEQGRRNRTL
jgi:hypothetical protein